MFDDTQSRLPALLADQDPSWPLYVVQHRDDAEEASRMLPGLRIIALDDARLEAELPSGGSVLLIGTAQRSAPAIRAAGVAETWGAHLPVGYQYLTQYLDEKAKAFDYFVNGPIDSELGLRELFAGIANKAFLLEVEPEQHPALEQRVGISPCEVLDEWQKSGPLVHEPTGIAHLDEMTGGGLVYGSTVVVNGAPDAGKTMLVAQIAHEYAMRGIFVGFLGVDEEPSDLLMRFLQRIGWSRKQCEQRDVFDMRSMREAVSGLPLRFYGEQDTVEAASASIAEIARQKGVKAAVCVDSLQTVRSEVEERTGSKHDQVTTRLRALRSAARRHRLIVVCTSEVGRAYYSGDPAARRSDLAAGKESGSIEYTARLQLMLRSVPNEPDLVELKVPKNKFGRVHRDDEKGIHLRMDRVGQSLTEATDYVPESVNERDQKRGAAHGQQTAKDAAIIAVVVTQSPGITSKRLEPASANAAGGMGHSRHACARMLLGDALVEIRGERTTVHHYLNGQKVPAEVMEHVPIVDRPMVLAARPPEPTEGVQPGTWVTLLSGHMGDTLHSQVEGAER